MGVASANMGGEEGTSLANVATRKDKLGITCCNFNKKGHYSSEYPKPDRRDPSNNQSGTQMLMSGMEEHEQSDFQFHQGGIEATTPETNSKLPQEWVLLDN